MVTKYELKQTHVDEEGNKTEETWRTYSRSSNSEPPYIKFYVKMVGALRDIPQETNSLIISIISRMSYANNLQKVNLTAEEIEDICEECHISAWTYRQQMAILIKRGIIAPKKPPTGKKQSYHGTFYVNSEYFAKGEWNDIKEIRSYVHLSPLGGSIHTEVSNELPEKTIEADVATSSNLPTQTRLFSLKGDWEWDLEGLAELEKMKKKQHLIDQEKKINKELQQREIKKLQNQAIAENKQVIESTLKPVEGND